MRCVSVVLTRHSLQMMLRQVDRSLNDLRGCIVVSSRLVTLGPAYGYFVNAVRIWLIVKEKSFSIAKR